MSGTLVLVRHGQSEWNLKNLFTGWRDPDLTELGIQEAEIGGKALADAGLKFDIAFTSVLKRAQDTLRIVLDKVGQPDLELGRLRVQPVGFRGERGVVVGQFARRVGVVTRGHQRPVALHHRGQLGEPLADATGCRGVLVQRGVRELRFETSVFGEDVVDR